MKKHLKRKILVIEDDVLLSKAICSKLDRAGYTCLHVTTAEQALAYLQDKIDLIWLDIYLPGMSGIDFLKKIQKKANMAGIPILVVTASAGAAARTKKAVTGMKAEFFTKNDFTLQMLVEKINRILKKV